MAVFGKKDEKVKIMFLDEMNDLQSQVAEYFAKEFYSDKYECIDGKYGLANVAATMVTMMGYEAPAIWEKSMIKLK